jgi:long-chain acyl-CoA synthetase
MHFFDGELPRTATKKVKRREVVTLLGRLSKAHEIGSAAPAGGRDKGEGDGWLVDVVAHVSGKPRARIHAAARLDELGFDSLMYTELGVALEAAGAQVPSLDELSGIQTVADLARFVKKGEAKPVAKRADEAPDDEDADFDIPAPVATMGRQLLGLGAKLVYSRVLKTEVSGQANIPYHTHFIVAPNHASHADIGLVKYALGDAGEGLAALAATDYFFDDRYKRAFFDNFTNLVPMDRSGSLRKSLERAEAVLASGTSMLIFPEGTRSATGEIDEFKASLGYLALRARVGILPMYLAGTRDVLPKGSFVLKGRDLGAMIGPFLEVELLDRLVEGLTRSEGYRAVALFTQRIVEALRDGRRPSVDVAAFRKAFAAAEGQEVSAP